MSCARTPEEFRELADHVRVVAGGMQDSAPKYMMLDIAASYETVADHAEFLAAAKRTLRQDGGKFLGALA